MNPELIPQLENCVTQIQSLRGSELLIIEQITRVPGNLNRHFCTQSVMLLELESVGITTSGAHLSLWGQIAGRQVGYQITVDLLSELQIQAEQIHFVESFGEQAERHSCIQLSQKHDGEGQLRGR